MNQVSRLRERHADMSIKDAGALLLEIGVAAGSEALNKTLERAFPPPPESDRPLAVERPSLGIGSAS